MQRADPCELKIAPFALALVTLAACACASQARADDPITPETRAIVYLAAEVPRWRSENGCFSCHHNGDAARALLTAQRLGHTFPQTSIDETLRWLGRPDQWENNGGKGPFSDKRLARIQFAAALAAAFEIDADANRAALTQAAELIARDQADDGSWPCDNADSLGAPASYGRPLATAMARQVLLAADPPRHRERIVRADQWLESLEVRSVPDAAAVLFGQEGATDSGRRAAEWLIRNQARDGGWGAFPGSPTESFDTAIAMLALRRSNQELHREAIHCGRAALIASQQPDGSWIETTRPAGSESYAQRLSTSAWATLALLMTAGNPPNPDVKR